MLVTGFISNKPTLFLPSVCISSQVRERIRYREMDLMEAEKCPIRMSEEDEDIIYVLKLTFACIGILSSSASIFSLWSKRYILIFRIVLYAMIANGFQITLQLVEIFPVHNVNGTNMLKNGTSWDLACKSFGFLDQCTAWMGHLCMAWVSFYMIYLRWNKLRLEESRGSMIEVGGVAFCFLFPFVFNWVPFMHDYYGFSGSWCWIKMSDQCKVGEGLLYIAVLYYGPLLLFVLFNLCCCIYIIISFVCDPRYQAKELLFVLLYPCFYGILFLVVAISRLRSIWEIKFKEPQEPALWIAHAVGDPLRIIVPSFLVVVSVWSGSLLAKYRTWKNKVYGGTEKGKLIQPTYRA